MPIQITVDRTNVCNNAAKNKRITSLSGISSNDTLLASAFHGNTSRPNYIELDISSVGGKRRRHDSSKIRKNFFPYRLMSILSCPSFKDCATWDKEGKSFAITDIKKFSSKSNLSSSTLKKESFARKLNRWGFRMNRAKGCGYYSHPSFCRDKPWLCESMRCQKSVNSRNDMRSEAPEMAADNTNKRNLIDCDFDSQNSKETQKKRRTNHSENNKNENENKFDLSRKGLMESGLKCFIDVLSEDYMCNRLKKYLLRRQLKNRELARIFLNAGHEASEVESEIFECEKATANVHDTVVKNAILALVS